MAPSLQALLFWQVLVHSVARDPFKGVLNLSPQSQRVDQCFCELQGPVDVCCCDVETVDTLNSEKIYPLIKSLIQFPYFKFYQVNLNQPCPFWPDDSSCVLKSCSVEECEESDIPLTLKMCDHEQEESLRLGFVNSTVSVEQQQHFLKWEEHDDSEESFCEADADRPDEMMYVDLLLNPERFTGYAGASALRIWSSIYKENCFRPEAHSSLLPFESSLIQDDSADNPVFGPNIKEFIRRFDSATTNGQGPSWLKNLYFAYLVVLRAIIKMEPYWTNHLFYTGLADDDSVNENVMKIVEAAKGCSSSLFDETMLFTGNRSQQLKEEFRVRFKNITRIMDCVGCRKCKLWGKLQVQGIGTALKILFSGKKTTSFTLQRREIVALFNVLGSTDMPMTIDLRTHIDSGCHGNS